MVGHAPGDLVLDRASGKTFEKERHDLASSIAFAAQRATTAEIAKLRAAFAGFETVIRDRDFRKLGRMDQVFHRTIAAATKNRALERHITILHNNASRFRYFGIPRFRRRCSPT